MTAVDLAADPEVDPATVPGLKFGTPRDYTRPTLGHLQAAFSRIWIGRRCPGCSEVGMMPWQRLVANVLGELDETGRRRYGFAVVTVQRQAGKSDLCVCRNAERCFSVPGYQSWYTAQTGQDARDEFLKFYDVTLAKTPLQRAVTLARGQGSERLTFPNLSILRPHPPTEEKLHGKQSDGNDIDEAWAFSREEGAMLLQAIAPTQLTRHDPQTVAWSAGGTPNSTWLADLVARIRQQGGGTVRLADDLEVPFAGFEFGIPDDADATDLDVIEQHHPARGHTITRRGLVNLRSQLTDPDGWARAAGNRWTSVIGAAIDGRLWQALRYPDPLPDDAVLGWGAARAEDGSHVIIACAAQLPDGRVVAEVADVLPTAWRAADVIAEWVDRDRCAVDPSGPSAGLAEELARKNLPNVDVLTGRQASAACQDILDAMTQRQAMFRQSPELDSAAAVAQTRATGDGGKAWSRSTSSGSVAALEAVTLAVRSARVGVRRGRPGADPHDTP